MKHPQFITIRQESPESWTLLVADREGGRLLYEAGGLKSLDAALEDLDGWRKGVVIV